ncbi:MAG: hypothetical protein Q6354_09265 [Candidatus Brocadiales bacterium]|nr:hypothetical protein [Candidatus Brocadiales bacterium]
MKNYVLTTLLLFAVFGGCAAPKGEIQNLYKYHFSLIRPSTGTLNFEDDTLFITFAPDSEKINLLIRNKSDSPIKIMWDEAAYVDKAGISHRVIGKGTRYEDKERPQTPTMVAPNSSVAEWVMPSDNIYHTFFRWKVSPMFPELITVSDISLWDRTTFRFILPVEVHGQHKHHEFEFQVRVQ